MYLVTVELEIDPDRTGEFRRMVLKHAENSLGEAGCLRFEVTVSEEDPARFFIYEAYEDSAALEIHRKQPYLAEFREKSAPLVKARKLATWNALSEG